MDQVNQLNNTRMRKRPIALLLRSPNLKPINQAREYDKADRPRTPYPVIGKRREQEGNAIFEETVAKKRKAIGDKGIVTASPRLVSFPGFGSSHASLGLHQVSPADLMRAFESILNQIDWSQLVVDVVGKERSAIFRNAFEQVLLTQVEELLKQDFEKMKEPDFKSGDGNSEDRVRHVYGLGDISQSDMEAEYGSEDYDVDEDEDEDDDDDDDEEDNEDEEETDDDEETDEDDDDDKEDGDYEEDGDFEVIADGASV